MIWIGSLSLSYETLLSIWNLHTQTAQSTNWVITVMMIGNCTANHFNTEIYTKTNQKARVQTASHMKSVYLLSFISFYIHSYAWKIYSTWGWLSWHVEVRCSQSAHLTQPCCDFLLHSSFIHSCRTWFSIWTLELNILTPNGYQFSDEYKLLMLHIC